MAETEQKQEIGLREMRAEAAGAQSAEAHRGATGETTGEAATRDRRDRRN